jgi:hypothetical protein
MISENLDLAPFRPTSFIKGLGQSISFLFLKKIEIWDRLEILGRKWTSKLLEEFNSVKGGNENGKNASEEPEYSGGGQEL